MELDVRDLPPARRHSTIFETFEALEVDDYFILVNDHDPVPLYHQFEANYARSFEWYYVVAGPEEWQIQISKLAATPLPQVMGNTAELAASDAPSDIRGAFWKVNLAERDLDANAIRLDPGTSIHAHAGPDLDILLLVLSGEGSVGTELDELSITAGDILWLPKRSTRQITAGTSGLKYLTINTHNKGLTITSR